MAPDREDVGFFAAMFGAVITLILMISIPLSIVEGNLTPLLAGLTIFGACLMAAVAMFFVGTYIFWFIVER